MGGTFNPLLNLLVEQTTGKTLPNPGALALSAFTDVENRAPPVMPKRLENLPPEQQYTAKTPVVAKWWGDLTGGSPIKFERGVKTIGANVASSLFALTDEIIYRTGLAEDKRPKGDAQDFWIINRFLNDSTPSQTKYVEKFYTKLSEEQMASKRGKENNVKYWESENRKISKLLKKYRDVELEDMDGREKRRELNEIQRDLNEAYKDAVLNAE